MNVQQRLEVIQMLINQIEIRPTSVTLLEDCALSVMIKLEVENMECYGCDQEYANQLGHECMSTAYVNGRNIYIFFQRAVEVLGHDLAEVNEIISKLCSIFGINERQNFSVADLHQRTINGRVYDITYGDRHVISEGFYSLVEMILQRHLI